MPLQVSSQMGSAIAEDLSVKFVFANISNEIGILEVTKNPPGFAPFDGGFRHRGR